jgi:phosphoribosyl-AMP cyclohydrolase
MLKFDEQGLVPAIIVDDASGDVLMMAYMNEEAFHLTRETGEVHFFSRSRQALWHKGEQSGNIQQVRDIMVNCEGNSLLVRVTQYGGAACHEGYRSCYYRRLLPDDNYETIAERVFDPADVYIDETSAATPANNVQSQEIATVEDSEETPVLHLLEQSLRQLYSVYQLLRDEDKTSESNTSRLLHQDSRAYLLSRLADEFHELVGVQTGEHVHKDRPTDTQLEGSQVGYWLFLLAATDRLSYDQFAPHAFLLRGYTGNDTQDDVQAKRQQCLALLATNEPEQVIQGLQIGFSIIGWACSVADISPIAPVEYDLAQMRRKGLLSA